VSTGKDILGIEYSTVPEQRTIKGENRLKFNGAVAFIEYFAKNFGDTIPDEHGKFISILVFFKLIVLLSTHIILQVAQMCTSLRLSISDHFSMNTNTTQLITSIGQKLSLHLQRLNEHSQIVQLVALKSLKLKERLILVIVEQKY
jgi:hypothetical protein